MAKQSITNVATKIVDLLTPLNSEERQRVVQGALTLLGEGQIALPQKAGLESDKDSAEQIEGISPRANVWLRQNGLTLNNLEQVFHIDDGKIELIASEIPGKDNKAKTLNIYILAGVSQFLLSGDASFDDKTARTSGATTAPIMPCTWETGVIK
jgi:hypothetical protein